MIRKQDLLDKPYDWLIGLCWITFMFAVVSTLIWICLSDMNPNILQGVLCPNLK